MDFIAPLVPIGLGAGRIGNFINAELWGKPTDLPWAMVFPRFSDPAQLARHPSQLYQFALEGVALFLILYFFSRKPRPTMAVSGMFALFYGIFRFIVEFVRVPDAQLGYLAWGWVTMGQILSMPMIIAGAVLIWLAYNRAPAVKTV
jgi:phosphatidylglycerol:prolipoprotein diacylglycerol transferase